MNIPYTKEELQKKFMTLPEDVQIVLASKEMLDKLKKISERFTLPEQGKKDMVNEVALVLFGLSHPAQFVQKLADTLGIDQENARKMAEMINGDIFRIIRESLRMMYGIAREKRAQTAESQAQKAAADKNQTSGAGVEPVFQKGVEAIFENKEIPGPPPEFDIGWQIEVHDIGPSQNQDKSPKAPRPRLSEEEIQVFQDQEQEQNQDKPKVEVIRTLKDDLKRLQMESQKMNTTTSMPKKDSSDKNSSDPTKDPYREPIS